MGREWVRWCKGAALAVEGDEVEVRFPDERGHRVRVEYTGEAFRLVGVVARRAVVEPLENITLRLWRLNRVTQVVGFRVDERERILGEAWVPKAGLSEAEFVSCLRQVAAGCDRLEYLLTGRDVE